MSTSNTIYCLVDDTALTRNLDEIEKWVSQGLIVLVVPLYTLSRLNVLKKDSSPIGLTARQAVKFLDHSTSSNGDLDHDPVILQGPDEQYPTWAEVELHYENEALKNAGMMEDSKVEQKVAQAQGPAIEAVTGTDGAAGGNALSQILLEKLNFAKDPAATSPNSTPPLSPSSSGPQSSKTSPEVKLATMLKQDQTPVPPSLKPLLNPVVWYVHEKKAPAGDDMLFLTNSADTMHLARDFGIPTKNIHQLRNSLGLDENEVARPMSSKESSKRNSAVESKTLFSYNDVESEDEEVVFKPRGQAAPRGTHQSRGNTNSTVRSKGGPSRSPRTSFSTPQRQTQSPAIPIAEIDPDSFDRGSFARSTTPLVNTSNHVPSPYATGRGAYRGGYGRGGSRGNGYVRGGYNTGFDRGSTRGRGRLFVP